MSTRVTIDELRVGMFVHLDLGWWAHPFALSSFQLQSADQISTIKGLGLSSVRWSPEKSLFNDQPVPSDWSPEQWAQAEAEAQSAADEAAAAAAVAAQAGADPANPAVPAVPAELGARAEVTEASAAADSASCSSLQGAAPAAHSDAAGGPQEPPRTADESPEQSAERRAHRAAMQAQRLAQQRCEQQYGEAGAACREAFDRVPDEPEAARAVCEGLTRALLDKLMVDGEMCVRVLSQASGDTSTAHALNVTVIALLMGRVFGFAEHEMLDLGLGALMHDVGKLELPERVRHADVPMSASEQALYRDHVAHGVLHGRRMGLSDVALSVIAQHHELADGSGFPQRLNQDRMSAGARIVALINRYDNLCNPLQPAAALTPHEALSMIFAQCRSQFDVTMLNAFIRMMGVYPPGSLVQLTDDRYATVVSCNSSRPLKPRVLVADLKVPVADALLLNLDVMPDLGIRRSVKAAQLPAAVRDYLSPRTRMVYFFEPVAVAPVAHPQVLAA